MAAIQESIEVEVPLSTAYNQWTQFKEFPQFMEGVESIDQLDDRRLHWVASHGGKRHEWDAEIVDQTPDTRVAWRDVTGETNAGEVTFESLDANRNPRRRADGLGARGSAREDRRSPGIRRPPHQGRSRPLQGVHRGPWPRDRRLARRHREPELTRSLSSSPTPRTLVRCRPERGVHRHPHGSHAG